MRLVECLPKNKHDVEAIARAKAVGFPALNKLVPQLLEWLQDVNWPVAAPVLDLLSYAGPENTSHIRAVLDTQDDVWKYYIVSNLIPRLRQEVRDALRGTIERIAYEPSEGEHREEVDAAAKELLATTK